MDIRALLTVVVAASLGFTYALRCRNEEDDQHQEEFQEAAKMCMSNLSNWDNPSDNNNGGNNNRRNNNYNNNGKKNYYTGNPNNRNDNNDNNYNSRSRPTSRNQQERERSNNKYRSGSSNNNNNNNNANNNNNNNKNNNNNSSSNNSGSSDNSALENIEPCIVHCIFKQMQMLDTDAMPDRLSVTNVMMRGVRDSKVKDFVEEAVDDCFDLLESDNKDNKCKFSKNLALCLEEKGRKNCEDWDTSEVQNQSENNNKNGNSNNGYSNNNNSNNNNANNNNGNNNSGSNNDNNRGNNRNNNDNSNYGNGGRPTSHGWGQQISRHIV